ncbi:AAA family ATPase [Okeania sp.]|uniref:trifunctional serine/threonine-protein kinase/ATP-binding protein/sensor histidine kinase n=1 Tax=Okeania sp. TaxID=3100323 RepID=UPI002B4AFEBA|nr:AAA family ATPase [Okeania sp.]MEB3342029.1 AAA family ATPase [Okeania sp.]
MGKTKTIKIANYQALELIYESERTEIYRGQNVENGQSVIIKLMRDEYPSFNKLVQFRNQYAITQNLQVEGIIKTYGLVRYKNRYALIMEDIRGVSLDEYQLRVSINLSEFLDIAIQLSEILHQLHNNSIIHKDIKPANILIDPETKQVKLIDFSISTLLPKETQTVETPKVLEGTPAYISPEQTGRMNRGIDYRSDFYCLGVTFYELLSGGLPFKSNDALELIYAHIALSPIPLRNRGILEGEICPQPISDMVMKLMAKNAEDRYQSALGLKYDLEKCQSDYREKGEIESFELGERDICARFLIPEKLYGREAEIKALLDAFERVSNPPQPPFERGELPIPNPETGFPDPETRFLRERTVAKGNPPQPPFQRGELPIPNPETDFLTREIVMVEGFSGIGKTVVINEVHKPIVRQRGYFIKGKFDQFNRNIPFSAFVQAFRSLMGQIISESDDELSTWKAKILETVGTNGQVLIDVIPELERVIGKQPPVPELSGSAAQNRFNLLFQKFIAIFATKEHPLVIFLDDLQWVDSASLNLMKVLMGDNEIGYLLLLGAYRDNEVFPAHPLMLTLADLQKQKVAISTITLAPLAQKHINQLVAETLSCSVKLAIPLTELIYGKTKGNPFFTTQFLKGLYEDELIVFNWHLGYWESDLVKVQDAALTDDVVEFMAGRLQKLPSKTQEVLKVAACIGNEFDLETLAIVREISSEEAAAEIWRALQERIVLPISEAYKFFQGVVDSISIQPEMIGYRFLHDRVQQAAYQLIPDAEKQIAHYHIGKRLLSRLSLEEREKYLFDIVNHLNMALVLIVDSKEREQLMQLNLQAGRKAKNALAYRAASEYYDTACLLLKDSSWQNDYQNHLAVYSGAVETAFLCGDFPRMEELGEIVLQEAQTFLDCVKVYEIKVQAAIAQNQLDAAIQLGLHFLRNLDIQLPEQVTNSEIEAAFAENDVLLEKIAIEDVVNFERMSDSNKEAAIRMITIAGLAMYVANPELLMLSVARQVNLCLQYGNTSTSADAYATYGLFLCGEMGEIEKGYQFGELAIAVLENLQTIEIKSLVYVLFNGFIRHWKYPCRDTLPDLQNAYHWGLEMGDLQNAALSAYCYCSHQFLCGVNLGDVHKEIEQYARAVESIQQLGIKGWLDPLLALTGKLIKPSSTPLLLLSSITAEKETIETFNQDSDRTGMFVFAFSKMLLAYLWNQTEEAIAAANMAREYLDGITGMAFVSCFYFYDTAILLSSQPTSLSSEEIDKIVDNKNKLQDLSQYGASNLLHKFQLLEAEYYRWNGEHILAMEMYDRAIAGAKENHYIQEEALANELAAKFYLDWDKEKFATLYMQEAYYCYSQWGAKAKVKEIEKRYPKLLEPILQTNLSAATASIAQITSNDRTQTATVANISSIIDFSSLLKASQTLSGEIELDRLLSTVMKIIIENAGATKGALLLVGKQGLTVEAIASRTGVNSQLTIDSLNQSIPLEENIDLPVGLVNFVRRTAETAILDGKTAQEQFAADTYLLHFHPQSLLCMPLFERGKLISILYLENSLTADAFTENRVKILDTLCAQAAISLENARLYQQAQKALKDLQQTQLQLVQQEKMATLGNLVAGVAHEINNPIGFIRGNIDVAQDYLQDLLTILALYAENTSPPESIMAEIEELEQDFIAEDFPKLITSLAEGCDRIRNISTSLRTFSRRDTTTKTEFNLHDGIDSTLLILKYRLKANQNRPSIEIVKNYSQIPLVKCYAGQLNQVFMNLLANGIDALEESNKGKTFTEIENNPNRITIRTKLSADSQNAIVEISDNGTGIPEEVKEKIFEQGFTTKEVGKGTGLGMAIAHQIITEKHGGKIICNSRVGEGTTFTIIIPK